MPAPKSDPVVSGELSTLGSALPGNREQDSLLAQVAMVSAVPTVLPAIRK